MKFVVDIKDLGSEEFKMALNIPVISSISYLPMKLQANKIYFTADVIVAVS